MGHQFGHVEKVVHMTDGQVEILHMTDCHVEKILHMRNVKKIYGKCGEIMCTMYGVLSHFMSFCSRISFFVIYAVLSLNIYLTIHALLRGEKFKKKLCPWRKNDKYEVWVSIPYISSQINFWDLDLCIGPEKLIVSHRDNPLLFITVTAESSITGSDYDTGFDMSQMGNK